MRIWRKRDNEEAVEPSVARAALAGVSREQLLQEALRSLLQDRHADRVGVWIEPDPAFRQNGNPAALHGLVGDRAHHDVPMGWRTLSLEAPLPEDLRFGGKAIQQNLQAFPAEALIGPLLELRQALWIPVSGRARSGGLILLGSKGHAVPSSSREHAESVAAELALALDLEEHLQSSRIRTADLALIKRALETCSAEDSSNEFLSRLVQDCVADAATSAGPGGAFAAIGVLENQAQTPAPSGNVEFRWRRGDESWLRALEKEPLAEVWRRALEARRMIGSDPPSAWASSSVARIVAFPLEVQGRLLGTLVVGLPPAVASLTTIDRLGWRALLAASALRQQERRALEVQRARSEQALLELLGEPVLLLNEGGRIIASSRGARELLCRAVPARESHSSTVIAFEQLSDFFCGHDRERVQRWLQESRRVSPSTSVTQAEAPQAQLHNGTRVRLRLVPVVPGQPVAVLLQPMGAFESTKLPDYAEAELQSVIEWLEEGVVLFDARENIRAMNTRFEQMAGFSADESGEIKSLEELIARLESQAAEPARFAERWRELARGLEGGVREELRMMRPAPRILERAARPVLDSIGRQLGRVEIYRDLTAQRVFHSKLLHTEKLAALGQMVSGIAHELSNPLTSILGYAQRLLLRQDGSGSSQEIRQIYEEAERAGAILRQLLSNARETVPERRLVSLNQVVLHAMELQRFSLAAEKIRVEMDLDPDLPFVHGDAGQLQQVLINLMTNAHQALEQQGRGGTIRLRTRRMGERRVLLEIEDNGPGIPKEIQARIFDPFFTTKPAGVGTGLGLAIVLSVVREHGGQVHLQRPPQGGAIFQIEIPAASERQQEEGRASLLQEARSRPAYTAPLPAEADRPAAAFESGKGARVLVVEDEPTVARLIADVLEDEGMHVDVLLDGHEALERAGRQSYDLVICDMKMPGLDGQRFHKSLQRAGNPLHGRFLFVTGDVLGAQTKEFLERNRLPHVAKPFRVEELTEKVHAVLQAQAPREESEAEVTRKNAARNG